MFSNLPLVSDVWAWDVPTSTMDCYDRVIITSYIPGIETHDKGERWYRLCVIDISAIAPN